MSKVKVKRQNPRMDMTAMCDVAFLLLTFFILTTKFKPNEPVQVTIPKSTAQIPIPEKDILLISCDKEGKVFFGVDDQATRITLLDKIAAQHNFQVTGNMQKTFKLMDQFGVPLDQLGQMLSLSPEDLGKFKQPGLTVSKQDTGRNDLKELIVLARTTNDKLRIAIKADQESNYKSIEAIIETLRNTKSNRFNLITSARNKPE
jgi:biopolymer transport protein ExbD